MFSFCKACIHPNKTSLTNEKCVLPYFLPSLPGGCHGGRVQKCHEAQGSFLSAKYIKFSRRRGTCSHPAGRNQGKKALDEGPTASVICKAKITCFLIRDCPRRRFSGPGVWTWLSWVSCSGSDKAAAKVQTGYLLLWRLSWGRSRIQSSSGCGQNSISFCPDCFSLAVGWRLPTSTMCVSPT